MTLSRARDAFLGLCYLAVVAAVALGAWLAYDQTFVDRSEVRLTTGTLGNALQVGSDVKLRGVPVGTVRSRLSRARTRLRGLVEDELAAARRRTEPTGGSGQVWGDRVGAVRSTQGRVS